MLPLPSFSVPTLPHTISLHSAVDMILTTLDVRDASTFEHSHRVAGLAELMGETMGLPEEQMRNIHYAAHLHDIGKIGVSGTVLNKPGALTKSERLEIQSHSVLGETILKKTPDLAHLAKIVRHHHERWDGKGYPDKLSGYDIPLESRIIGLVDAFDAMTSDRVYRQGKSDEWGMEEIKAHRGTQFCPDCVDVFLTLRSKLKLKRYRSNLVAVTAHQVNVEHNELMHSRAA